MRSRLLMLVLVALLPNAACPDDAGPQHLPGTFAIAQLHYSGGGDWYSAPTALPNLLRRIARDTPILAVTPHNHITVKADDPNISRYPMLFLTGHGQLRLSELEVINLRHYLLGGGFLHADDNYGLDQYFRREMDRVLPEAEMRELPQSHPIYSCFYQLPQGLPKIHEHHGGPAHGYGYFVGGRMVCYYSYNTDLGNGWEDAEVHSDPPDKREEALRMGVNIAVYALTH